MNPCALHIAHVAMLRPARVGASRCAYFEARCSCGWIGAARATMTRAYRDLDQHEIDHPIHSHVNTKTLSEGAN